MKKTTLLAVMLLWASLTMGQNIQVTFTGTGEANIVDSVTALNMSTGEEITLPGNEVLILETVSGSDINNVLISDLKLFPNPFQHGSKVIFDQYVPGNVNVTIQNLSGQILFQSDQYLEVGHHLFDLSLNSPGIFLINFSSETERRSIKAICAEANNSTVGLFRSSYSISSVKSGNSARHKNNSTSYGLSYSPEDMLHLTCKSGSFTTIIIDSPDASINYEIEFIDCTDTQNKTYSVITIGNQTWMAENLVYLPAVTTSGNISDTVAHYYVYDYQGSSISDARDTDSYKEYGVLYNQTAAMEACHAGWHLPDEDEWGSFILYLERNGYGFLGYASMIGKAVASQYGWDEDLDGGTVGKDQSSNNKSGFCILPAGYLYGNEFVHQGFRASFWSSTKLAQMKSVSYILASDMRGFGRGTPASNIGLSVRCIKDE